MHLDFSFGNVTDTEDAFHELRSLRSDQSAEAENLSLSDGEAHSAERLLVNRRIVLHFHDGLADFVMVFRIDVTEFPSHHLRNNLLCRHLLRRPRSDVGTVPHDGDVVGNPLDFIHFVGNVNHGDALLLQVSHDLKEELHFLIGKRGSRLVEDDDLCIVGNRFCNFHHLHLPDGKRRKRRLYIVIQSQLG